jgi:hypothetical protein
MSNFRTLQPVPYPTKNLAEGELIVAADIQKVLGKSFAFIGPGDSVQDDRLLIKVGSRHARAGVGVMMLVSEQYLVLS